MRIGVIASIAHRLPPASYGPWEQIASTLTEGFVARGHDVTLFATADSATTATLVGTAPTGYEEDTSVDAKVWEGLHNATVFERAGRFDVIANHFDFMPLTYSRLVDTPMVTTDPRVLLAGDPARLPGIRRHRALRLDQRRRPQPADPLRRHDPPRDRPRPGSPSSPSTAHYLLFLGRIHPDKGTHLAIDVAREAGVPLVIAGIVQDQDYFETLVLPHVDGQAVRYVGPVGPTERDALLGGATALLHLIDFDEPFGLSVVEALATGTPVIASPRGSLPEIIRDGLTGFLVADHTEAVRAVARLAEIDRAECRADAETRFGADRMVDDYIALFHRLTSGSDPGTVEVQG